MLGSLYAAAGSLYRVLNQYPSTYKQNKSGEKTNFNIFAWEYEAPTTVFCSWGLDPELFFQKGDPFRLLKMRALALEQHNKAEHGTQAHTQNGLFIPTECHRAIYQPLHQGLGGGPKTRVGRYEPTWTISCCIS